MCTLVVFMHCALHPMIIAVFTLEMVLHEHVSLFVTNLMTMNFQRITSVKMYYLCMYILFYVHIDLYMYTIVYLLIRIYIYLCTYSFFNSF